MIGSLVPKILAAVVTTGALLGAAAGASAAAATATFAVSVNVLKTCSVSATNLAFGNYTPGGGTRATTSRVSVLCTKGSAASVALNGGSTAGGTVAQRLMAESGGNGKLQYNLYTTAAHSTVWGDGTGSSVTESLVGAGMAPADALKLTVYGQLPDNVSNQAAPVTGAKTAYADAITVTVTY
jgi:spore coat protein U-like protein